MIKLLKEQKLPEQQRSQLIREFIKHCIKELGLKSPLPKVKLTSDKSKTETYGYNSPQTNEIVTYIGERSLGDICRTVGHELVHELQKQQGRLKENSGKTGSPEENEANAKAGILLRNFGKKNPQIFE